MQDGDRSSSEQLGPRLEASPQRRHIGRLAVTDGDHGALCGEHVQLAELDCLRIVDVARRAQHAEQRLTVALELRALMGVHCVCH